MGENTAWAGLPPLNAGLNNAALQVATKKEKEKYLCTALSNAEVEVQERLVREANKFLVHTEAAWRVVAAPAENNLHSSKLLETNKYCPDVCIKIIESCPLKIQRGLAFFKLFFS